MSRAAEEVVNALSPTDVKGSTRYFLDTIARLIAEGQTTTPPITDPEFAALMRYDERTVRRRRHVLAKRRWIAIKGGGQGRPASYELLLLPGAGKTEPSLPLIGIVKPPRAPQPPPPRAAHERDLFTESPRVDVATGEAPPIRSYTVGQNVRSWAQHFGHFVRSCGRYFGYLGHFGHFVRSFRSYAVGHFVRSSRMDVTVDDARARDSTYTLKETHTPNASVRTEAPLRPDPPQIPVVRHAWHSWCGARVCVPKFLHEEFIRKQQRAGELLVDVEARLFAFYERRSPSGPIPDKDDAAFWRRMYTDEFAKPASRTPPIRAAPLPAPRPSGCDHDPPCRRWTEHRERLHADVVAARAQQSG